VLIIKPLFTRLLIEPSLYMPYAEAAPIVTVPLFVISIPVYEGLELLIAASLSPLVIDPGESMTKH